MRKPDFYRYFLGFRPCLDLCSRLALVGARAGQLVSLELLHLTLCVISEKRERDHFLLARVRSALAGKSLSSFPVHLGKVSGGPKGAMLNGLGCQHDIQDFYNFLISLLAKRAIAPLYRKSGLRAHVTLGHEPCLFKQFKAPIEWFPAELLLIESEVGLGRHNVVGRWPLLTPRQRSLPFDAPFSERAAA
jgi:hypothetical protein